MAKLAGANDYEKLQNLTTKNYKDQVVWFLNAFWEDFAEKEAEQFWKYVHQLAKLDLQKGKDGNAVDELVQHRFLEFFNETQTVAEMRDNLRSTGAIVGNVKLIPITHYLIFKYKIDWHVLVNAPQGDNRKEIEEAQQLLDQVQALFSESEAKHREAKEALHEAQQQETNAKNREAAAKASEAEAKAREAAAKASEAEAKSREADAKTKEGEAKNREAESKAAQEELEAALRELHAQEKEFNDKTAELKAKSEDESIGLVTRNKAKAELSQHLASDPLPLRRSKINQEAAVKKADKATQAAADARAAAETASQAASKARAAAEADLKQATTARHHAEEDARQATEARSAAEAAREHATRAKEEAEQALENARQKVDEAEAYLESVKSRPGSAKGALWWIDRELHEAKAYLPEKKGGFKKK